MAAHGPSRDADGTSQQSANRSYRAVAYAALRRTADARAIVDSLIAESKVRYIDRSYIARPLVALGDRDGALTWLERMVDDHATTPCFIAYDREWKPLRADPRFVALVREVHSPRK